jgi:hypothetical protein
VLGNLTITSNATGSPQSVSLSGTGIQATLTLGTGSLPGSAVGTIVYGANPLTTPSGIGAIQVTNTGTANLTIGGVSNSNNFQFTLVTPPSGMDCRTVGTVAPGSSCFLGATFSPTAVQVYTSTISIVDNAPGSPHAVQLSGTGFASAGPAPTFAKK